MQTAQTQTATSSLSGLRSRLRDSKKSMEKAGKATFTASKAATKQRRTSEIQTTMRSAAAKSAHAQAPPASAPPRQTGWAERVGTSVKHPVKGKAHMNVAQSSSKSVGEAPNTQAQQTNPKTLAAAVKDLSNVRSADAANDASRQTKPTALPNMKGITGGTEAKSPAPATKTPTNPSAEKAATTQRS